MMLKQNGTVDTTKNATRLASVLGTWTAETRLKTSIGDNTLTAWFVMHIMPGKLLPLLHICCFINYILFSFLFLTILPPINPASQIPCADTAVNWRIAVKLTIMCAR